MAKQIERDFRPVALSASEMLLAQRAREASASEEPPRTEPCAKTRRRELEAREAEFEAFWDNVPV